MFVDCLSLGLSVFLEWEVFSELKIFLERKRGFVGVVDLVVILVRVGRVGGGKDGVEELDE